MPLLDSALARQLQELPGVDDGLSLTERLVLRILGEHGGLPAGRVFAQLMQHDEPLPYVGNLMFHALLQPLIDASQPLLREEQGNTWPQRHLQLTELGDRILAGQAHWLDQQPPARWVGGVYLAAGKTPWMVSAEGQVWRR